MDGLPQGIMDDDKGFVFHWMKQADFLGVAIVEEVEGFLCVFVGAPVAAEVDGPFLWFAVGRSDSEDEWFAQVDKRGSWKIGTDANG